MDKKNEVEKNINSRHKFKKNFKKDSNYDEEKYRRLDSLARLFQGDMDCAAVCFDGDELLVAVNFMPDSYFNSDHTYQKYTNRLYAHNLFNIVKDHLIYVAHSMDDYKSKLKNFYGIDYKDLFSYGDLILSIQTSKDKVKKYIHDNVNLYNDSSYFYNNVNISLEKITQSLIITCFDKEHEKAIDFGVFNALVNDKIRLLEPDKIIKSHNNKALHAEMIILDYLYEKYFRENASSNNIPIPCHIGISRPCCLTCEITLKILNEYLDNKYDNNEFNLILYRQDHDWLFPATIPLILRHENFKDAFLIKFIDILTNQIYTGTDYRFIDLTGKLKDEDRKKITQSEINEVTLEQAFNIEPCVRVKGYQTTYDNSDSHPLNTEEFIDIFDNQMITTEKDNDEYIRSLRQFEKDRFGEQPISEKSKEAEESLDKNPNIYSKDVVTKYTLNINFPEEDTSKSSNNSATIPPGSLNNTNLSNNNAAVENKTNDKNTFLAKNKKSGPTMTMAEVVRRPNNNNPPPIARGPHSQIGNRNSFLPMDKKPQNKSKNTNYEKENQNNRHAKK